MQSILSVIISSSQFESLLNTEGHWSLPLKFWLERPYLKSWYKGREHYWISRDNWVIRKNIFQWEGTECGNDRVYLSVLIEWGSRLLTEADIANHCTCFLTVPSTVRSLQKIISMPFRLFPLIQNFLSEVKFMRFLDNHSLLYITQSQIDGTVLTELNNHEIAKTFFQIFMIKALPWFYEVKDNDQEDDWLIRQGTGSL